MAENEIVPEIVLEEAKAALRENKPGLAIKKFNSVLGKVISAEFYFWRGQAYQQLKQYYNAIQDLSRAIDMYPNFSAAYLNRGLAHFNSADKTSAFLDWQRAKELGEASADQYLNNYLVDFNFETGNESISTIIEKRIRNKVIYLKMASFVILLITSFFIYVQGEACFNYEKHKELYGDHGNWAGWFLLFELGKFVDLVKILFRGKAFELGAIFWMSGIVYLLILIFVNILESFWAFQVIVTFICAIVLTVLIRPIEYRMENDLRRKAK